MKSILATVLSVILFVSNSDAQKNYYKAPQKIENEKYSLEFKDIIITTEESKLAVIITNKTNNILLLKHSDSKFDLGNVSSNASPKKTYIFPNKISKRVLRIPKGELVDKFILNFDGIYEIPTDANIIKMEGFQLPAKTNSITSGNFSINLKKLKQKTQETEAIFECKYNGDDFGLLNSSKLSITAKDKNGNDVEFANDNKKNKIKILKNGDSDNILAIFHIEGRILDMQFATLNIKWNETFVESKSKKLSAYQIEFELDVELTEEKK